MMTESVCPEDVVQVAGNALALGDGGEVLDFFLRLRINFRLVRLRCAKWMLLMHDTTKASPLGEDKEPDIEVERPPGEVPRRLQPPASSLMPVGLVCPRRKVRKLLRK
jgi:hypothetical protein